MKCNCGSRCDLLNAKVIVDYIEKEYFCLQCAKSIFLSKYKNGERHLRNRDGSTISQWKI